MTPTPYRRGALWLADLSPTKGHEQSGVRPVLIVSDDTYNDGPADLVAVVPLTTVARGVPLHVQVTPPDGGLAHVSYIMCDQIRVAASRGADNRFIRPLGTLSTPAMREVEDCLLIFLRLQPPIAPAKPWGAP